MVLLFSILANIIQIAAENPRSTKPKAKSNDADQNQSQRGLVEASANPLKRKLRDAENNTSDPKLKEFLNVMQATAKTKTWQNEANEDEQQIVSKVPDDAESSDDDMQVIESKRTKKPRHDVPASDEKDEQQLQPVQDAESQFNGVSKGKESDDKDWLRSKTSKLLDDDELLQEDNAPREEPQSKSDVEMEDHAGPIEVDGSDAVDVEDDGEQDENVSKIKEHGRLYLRNLPFKISEDELREHFEGYGALQEVR